MHTAVGHCRPRSSNTHLLNLLHGCALALLSSYDHLSLPAGAIQPPQQWGVWCIAASVALVVVVVEGCDAKQLLNWRRDPGYEQRKMQYKLRMKQLESETKQLRQRTGDSPSSNPGWMPCCAMPMPARQLLPQPAPATEALAVLLEELCQQTT